MNLKNITKTLQNIAPLKLAEKWDNVGLLVEPSPPHIVTKILLTNDLTESVIKEGIDKKVGMIISYHPPIFRPLKRITWKNPKERIITLALENRIAIYSPHTCCDVVHGGVNDWLAKSLGSLKFCYPIKVSSFSEKQFIEFEIKSKNKESFCKFNQEFSSYNIEDEKCSIKINKESITTFLKCLSDKFENVEDFQMSSSIDEDKDDGIGRICLLDRNTSLRNLIENIKSYIQLPYLRVAVAENKSVDDPIKTVGLCAGSGNSVLSDVNCDLYLTGEMSHHEVLAATSSGVSVILCEHSNSERGYLHQLKNDLNSQLNLLEIFVSEVDKDPLTIM